MNNALRKRNEDPVALEKLDAILHSINYIILIKNKLVFFFNESAKIKEITGFFRSFFAEIRSETRVKMLSEPIVLLPKELNSKNQLTVTLPNIIPKIKEGDIVRIHLLGKRGKDFII